MKSASNSDIKNIVYANNSEDVAIEMANVDIHNITNSGPPYFIDSAFYLNHNPNVFTPEIIEFKMINEPITMNFNYTVPITSTNCNIMEFIPRFSDGNVNVCILNNQPNLCVPQASVCDGFVNTLEEMTNLSSVECLSHTSYIIPQS